MNTIRSDSGTGKGLSKTEFTMVKIATFAPRHTASVRMAVVENPRSFHNAFIEIAASRSTPSIFLIRYDNAIVFVYVLSSPGVPRFKCPKLFLDDSVMLMDTMSH